MADNEQQIKNMIGFIEAEAKEKVSEMDQEAQEQYTIDKQREIETAKKKIRAEFERKEKQVYITQRVSVSKAQKEERLRVLKAREEQMQEMLAKARANLLKVTADAGKYKALVIDLITQAALTLKVPGTPLVVSARAKDQDLVKSVLSEAQAKYKKVIGQDLKITLGGDKLSDEVIGGVIVSTADDKVKCDNTLLEREKTLVREIMPQLRAKLFE